MLRIEEERAWMEDREGWAEEMGGGLCLCGGWGGTITVYIPKGLKEREVEQVELNGVGPSPRST